MFEKLFQRVDRLDVDRLIFDIAEYKRGRDYESFCQVIKNRVFFLRVDPASIDGLPRGVPHRIQSTDRVKLTGLANVQGLTLLPLYTCHGDKRLGESYVEVEGLAALRMAVQGIGIDGLLFQNREQSYVLLRLEQIRVLLSQA